MSIDRVWWTRRIIIASFQGPRQGGSRTAALRRAAPQPGLEQNSSPGNQRDRRSKPILGSRQFDCRFQPRRLDIGQDTSEVLSWRHPLLPTFLLCTPCPMAINLDIDWLEPNALASGFVGEHAPNQDPWLAIRVKVSAVGSQPPTFTLYR